MERIVISALESSEKICFHLTNTDLEVWAEKSVLAIQHIENRKSLTVVHPPPGDQTDPLAYKCIFTFLTSYIKWA